jgi:hypothetical protein
MVLGACVQALRRNLATYSSEHPLARLRRAKDPQHPGDPPVGTLPDDDIPFPATKGAISCLTDDQLDKLARFYGESFAGPCIAARQQAFCFFVGCRCHALDDGVHLED